MPQNTQPEERQMEEALEHPHADPDPPRRAVPWLWRIQQAHALRAFYGDLEPCELADLGKTV